MKSHPQEQWEKDEAHNSMYTFYKSDDGSYLLVPNSFVSSIESRARAEERKHFANHLREIRQTLNELTENDIDHMIAEYEDMSSSSVENGGENGK